MIVDVKTTKVFSFLEESKKKITVMQGGTRSGKTYNIIQWLIIKYLNEENRVLSICRLTRPSLKGTVMRDFFEILQKYGIYDEKNYSKSEHTYRLGTNIIEFLNLDDAQKIRGRKRHDLFVNEANEITQEIWKQLLFRTENKIVRLWLVRLSV
jgi:phage terminase large subunit